MIGSKPAADYTGYAAYFVPPHSGEEAQARRTTLSPSIGMTLSCPDYASSVKGSHAKSEGRLCRNIFDVDSDMWLSYHLDAAYTMDRRAADDTPTSAARRGTNKLFQPSELHKLPCGSQNHRCVAFVDSGTLIYMFLSSHAHRGSGSVNSIRSR